MLKIKDNVDLKELEKYHIYPVYNCDERTGKSYIVAYEQSPMMFERLIFKKQKKIIARLRENDLILETKAERHINLDTLYDLIKADLVEKSGGIKC